MEEQKKTFNFTKSKNLVVKLVDDAIENKEYWKALRLLYSLLQENTSIVATKLKFKLFSCLPYFVGMTDVFIEMLLSQDPDLIILGAKGLVAHAKEHDSETAEFYVNFAKNRLKNRISKEEYELFDKILNSEKRNNGFYFVEKELKNHSFLVNMDKALNNGKLDEVFEASLRTDDPIAHKMAAEAYVLGGNFKKAEAELNKIPDDKKDIYFYSVCARIAAQNKNEIEIKKWVDKLINSEIKFPEELIFISEALLDLAKPNEVVALIEKYQQDFEFYYPIYFTKAIAYFNLKLYDKARENFVKTYLLNDRQVAAKEFAYLLEGKKIANLKIGIHSVFPKEIIESVKNRYEYQVKLSEREFLKLSVGKIRDMLCWIELFENNEMAERYLIKCICCRNGIDAIKDVLLSFCSSDWLKTQCIRMLIFSGADSVDIWFTTKNKLKTVKLLLPKFLLSETEVQEQGFFSEDINYNKFLYAYATAFSILCFDNSDFERRLAEVTNRCIVSVISEFNKQKSNKLLEKYILAILLYATCSDNLPCEFSCEKIKNGSYDSYEKLAELFKIDVDEIRKLVKIIYANV